MEKIPDLHHVTAMASDPQRNLDFHNGPLRLRFVNAPSISTTRDRTIFTLAIWCH
jgi:hypothetical protein